MCIRDRYKYRCILLSFFRNGTVSSIEEIDYDEDPLWDGEELWVRYFKAVSYTHLFAGRHEISAPINVGTGAWIYNETVVGAKYVNKTIIAVKSNVDISLRCV